MNRRCLFLIRSSCSSCRRGCGLRWTRLSPLSHVYLYFIIPDATVNGIVFLVVSVDCSLPGCGNTTDLCMLTLYSVTLVNLSITADSCVCMSRAFRVPYVSKLCCLGAEMIFILPFQFRCLFFFLPDCYG